jgi:hypothetical protein
MPAAAGKATTIAEADSMLKLPPVHPGIIPPVIAKYRLVAGGKLRCRTLGVEVALCGECLQLSLDGQVLPLDLLIELLLLKLGSDERIVVEIAAALQILAEQIQVGAHCRRR